MAKNSYFTIPNILSLLRLCLIPFITTTYVEGMVVLSAVLLAISGITDMLDGFIARRFNQISSFGKFIDPVADKLTMAAVAFALMLRHVQLWPMMVALVIKECLMLIGAAILFHRGTRPSESKIFGKISTAVLYVILFGVMIIDVIELLTKTAFMPDWALWAASGISCLFMLFALLQYYPIFRGINTGTYNIETEKFEGETK